MFFFEKYSPDFTSHGEFIIYTAAIITPSIFIILKDYESEKFIYRHFFAGLCGLLLALSMLLYAAVTTVHVVDWAFNKDIFKSITIVMFILSVLISYFIFVLDRIFMDPDPRGSSESERRRLRENFESTGDENA